MYDVFYRAYSTFDVHGLYPLERRIDRSDVDRESLQPPTPWMAPAGSTVISTWALGWMAQWVFDRFHLDHIELKAARDAIEPPASRMLEGMLASLPDGVREAMPPVDG